MLESLGDVIECPICLETMVSPIRQCKNGHSICDGCATRIHRCPLCKSAITTGRNYQLEKVIANLKELEVNNIPCKYNKKGCKIKSNKDDLEIHEPQCKNREYTCEGKTFANWNCNWKGDYENIFHHFKADHNKHTWMEFQTSVHLKIDLSRDFSDIQIITFNKNLFWYKHKIDVQKETAYWIFQYIGPSTQANKYFYEFILRHGPLRQIKFREVCSSDCKNTEEIIDSGKSISVPFNTLKNFLREDQEITFTFKIGEVQESFENSKNQNVKQFISNVCSGQQIPVIPPNQMQGQQIQYQHQGNAAMNFSFPPNHFSFTAPQNFPNPGMAASSVQFGGPYNTGFFVPNSQFPPTILYQYPQPQPPYVRPNMYQIPPPKK